MRKIVLDELSSTDIRKIKDYLDAVAIPSSIEGLYWVDLTDDLLDGRQCEHDACKPYRFAIELLDDSVHLELLIRSANTMRCSCINYATPQQREMIFRFGERMIDTCGTRT